MSRVVWWLGAIALLVAVPVLVGRTWKQSRTQIHSISHGRG